MSKLNDKEVKEIMEIENCKKMLVQVLDTTINEMTYIRMKERLWWGKVVEKYSLNKKILHRIWIDGEIIPERRMSHGHKKIF